MNKYINLPLVVFIFLALCGCSPAEPWQHSAHWNCDTINMSIDFLVDESGYREGPTYSQVIINDVVHKVGVAFQKSAIAFFCDLDEDGVEERILDSTWYYHNGNLVINLSEDDIGGDIYNKLIFIPTD